MSIPATWPQVLDFFGTPLVIEPSTGQLASDAGLLPIRLARLFSIGATDRSPPTPGDTGPSDDKKEAHRSHHAQSTRGSIRSRHGPGLLPIIPPGQRTHPRCSLLSAKKTAHIVQAAKSTQRSFGHRFDIQGQYLGVRDTGSSGIRSARGGIKSGRDIACVRV